MANDFIFPFPLPFHVIFSIVGALFFLIQYARKKYVYMLLVAFAIPSTLLVYFCTDKLSFTLLGLEELILLILIFVFSAKSKKLEEAQKAKEVSNENNNSGQENSDQ